MSTPAINAQAAANKPSWSRGIDLSAPLAIVFALTLCVLVLLPLTWLLIYALTDTKGVATFANFKQLFTDPAFVDPLLISLGIATSVGVSCCAIAAPMAWLVARTDMPWASTVRLIVTASFVTPPFLGAIAWELLAAPNSGLLNQLYRGWIGDAAAEPLFDIYTIYGLIFVITCYTFPYVFVLVANALERVPGDLEDAASMLGSSKWTTARRITVPLVMPALMAGLLVAFLQAITLFGSPAILALPAGFHTITTKIWSLFQYPPKPELAAAASLPLLLLTVGLLRMQAAILGRKSYAVVGGKSAAPRLIPLNRLRWPAAAFCFGLLALPVFLPYGALLNAAFSKIPSQPVTLQTLTLHNFNFVYFELSATKLALKNTFLLAVLAATIGSLLALVIAYMTSRKAVPGHRILGFLATAPIAIPGIVLGVGLFLSYTRPPFVLYGTIWILLVAYVTIELPSAYQQMRSAFHAVNPELEEASRILGATRLQVLAHVTGPLLRTSLLATWCFTFVAVVRELSAAVILFTSETKVVSVLIFDLKESGDLAAIAVLGLSMLVLTAGVVYIANRLVGGTPGVRLRNN